MFSIRNINNLISHYKWELVTVAWYNNLNFVIIIVYYINDTFCCQKTMILSDNYLQNSKFTQNLFGHMKTLDHVLHNTIFNGTIFDRKILKQFGSTPFRHITN